MRLFVLTSKIRCSSKNNFHNSNYLSKGVQKNMLKAWDFTKNRLCHRYFDNNLQKIFSNKYSSEYGTGQIVLIVVLMVSLWFNFQIIIVD